VKKIFSALSSSEEEYPFWSSELDVQDSIQSKVCENKCLNFEHFYSSLGFVVVIHFKLQWLL